MPYASSVAYLLARLPQQVYIIIMEDNRIFSFQMWIDLILDRLTGPGNVFVKCLRLVLAYRRSYKFDNNLRRLKY